MASLILPFKATYYNPRIVKDLSLVTCPPYDVIDKESEAIFRKTSVYNFCNILLARGNNYLEIKRKWKQWHKEGILIEDKEDCLYLYAQDFSYEGRNYCRFGIISLLRMDNKVIFPHERTLKAPKEDRKKILQVTEANLCPIFTIVPKSLRVLKRLYERYSPKEPIFVFRDYAGIYNRIWKISDKKEIQDLTFQIRREKLLIADGHHRYEVAYDFYQRNKNSFSYLNYILAYITDIQDGLLVLPTHRIVSIREGSFLNKLQGYFYIFKVNKENLLKRLKARTIFSFGIYYRGNFYYLKLKDNCSLRKKGLKMVYKDLDSYILHNFVFELLGLKDNFLYAHSLEEIINLAYDDKVAFILRDIPLANIFKIIKMGLRLPEKTTYFYPKLLSGIILRRFERMK